VRFVRHLPGWYAQKHPDEDWAETFAVWMTPGANWKEEYRSWPEALAKLESCQQIVASIADHDPVVTVMECDEDANELEESLEHFYRKFATDAPEPMPAVDGPLRVIFDETTEHSANGDLRSAADLIRQIDRGLAADVYRWTGHFPERTLRLTQHLAARAESLQQVYRGSEQQGVVMALTTLVTALAMNFVYRGSYVPAADANSNA
jgi:hypothetical protein